MLAANILYDEPVVLEIFCERFRRGINCVQLPLKRQTRYILNQLLYFFVDLFITRHIIIITLWTATTTMIVAIFGPFSNR